MPTITINGKTYTQADDVPPEDRAAYQKALEILHDSDGNGIPDFLEGKGLEKIAAMKKDASVEGQPVIFTDGKVYSNLDEIPPDVRLKYDQAIAKLGPLLSDTNRNGIPDILEGRIPENPNQPAATPLPFQSTPFMPSQEPPPSVIQEEKPNYKAILLILVFFLVMALGFGAYLLVIGYQNPFF